MKILERRIIAIKTKWKILVPMLVAILVIFISWGLNSVANVNFYKNDVIEYLNNKYGNDNSYEIKSMKYEKEEWLGDDGRSVLLGYYIINAEILIPEKDIEFQAYISLKQPQNFYKKVDIELINDNLDDKILGNNENLEAQISNEVSRISENITNINKIRFYTIEEDYGHIPAKDEITLKADRLHIDINGQELKKESTPQDIVDFLNPYLTKIFSVFDKYNIKEYNKIDISIFVDDKDEFDFSIKENKVYISYKGGDSFDYDISEIFQNYR